jgi:RNA polymerase sigma factor (sigma-70 family)
MTPSKLLRAKQKIYDQDVPLTIKRSAWRLFEHELQRINPATSKPFSQQRALSNTLKWMVQQKERLDTAYKELSPTQKKIIDLLVLKGFTQKQMCLELGVTRDTVKHHYMRIKKKVGVTSMYQVVAVAVERGWVNAPQMEE